MLFVGGEWNGGGRFREGEDRARTHRFFCFGNPGVPFPETRNQREIPDGRKMANSLLPDPLTASFRARGDTELKESRRKTHSSGCSP